MTGSAAAVACYMGRPAVRGGLPAAVLIVLLLAACGSADHRDIRFAGTPASSPSAQIAVSPSFTGSEFVADDGARLPLRRWLPRMPPSAVILALHGFGDYSHAFEKPAASWAARGIATYAYDQRGFGAAPGHGLWAGEGRLALDAIEAARLLRQAYPGRPLYLLGESMGGAIALLAATGQTKDFAAPPGTVTAPVDGLILSAPALWARSTMDLLPRVALFVSARLFPDMTVTGSGLHIQASDNMPMLEALARDPLVLKGSRVDAVYGLVDLMDDALAAAPHLTLPTLLLYGAHDEVIPRHPIAEFVAHLPADPGRQRRLAYYRRGYHLLLRDLEGPLVANDVASWVRDRHASLPSGADGFASAAGWPPAAPSPASAMPLAEAGASR